MRRVQAEISKEDHERKGVFPEVLSISIWDISGN
jgi:hypothetical protein